MKEEIHSKALPRSSPTCYYCGRDRHLAFFCGIMKQVLLGAFKWIPKTLFLMIFSNTPREYILLYLDRGCSIHMTGNPSIFSSFIAQEGVVTFGDNGQGKILGKLVLVRPILLLRIFSEFMVWNAISSINNFVKLVRGNVLNHLFS